MFVVGDFVVGDYEDVFGFEVVVDDFCVMGVCEGFECEGDGLKELFWILFWFQ